MIYFKHENIAILYFCVTAILLAIFSLHEFVRKGGKIEMERNSNQLFLNRIKIKTLNPFSKIFIFHPTLSQQAASSKEEKTLTL